MDCASCALKIENAMKRLPGVSDIQVSYGQESLSLTFDEGRTSRVAIENKIRTLGYKPVGGAGQARGRDGAHGLGQGHARGHDHAHDHGHAHGHAHDHAGPARGPWWRGRNAVLTAAIGVLFLVAATVAHAAPEAARWAYAAAALVAVAPFARRAYAGAVSGTPFSIEMLMTIAAVGAILIGAVEEAVVVVFLFALGELLETIAAGKARAGIESLAALVPREALRERAGGLGVAGSAGVAEGAGSTDDAAGAVELERVPASALAVGDIVVVRPGDRVPSDGRVIGGAAEVDEAPVTGESVPVAKAAGAEVYAGSISTNGELRVEVSRAAADNTIARIVHLVEQAQESKAPTARLIDRFSRWYTPAAMGAALLVAIVPPLLFGAAWTTWIYRALATLLIACPCALVISTPAAIASALAAGARRGLLVKGGAALETLGRVRTVAFDKTGTLTIGRPQVTDIVPVAGAAGGEPVAPVAPDAGTGTGSGTGGIPAIHPAAENDLLAMAAAVERKTSHPLGAAIVAAAAARGLELPASYGAALTVPGKAVTARLKGGFASVGSPRYAAEQAPLEKPLQQRLEALEQEGKTVVAVLSGKRLAGLIALRDEPRDDAARAVGALHRMGVDTVMLTGDNRRTARAVGSAVGVRPVAELLPDAKLAEIAALRQNGSVAMVGDGINDAPALAAASVGIAMGSGTDVALETADAALLHDRVAGVAELIALSRATLSNIWQNIGIALGLKAVFLATTLLGVTSLWMAILADTGATVLVTANALRLLRRGR
ncbi:heavy metal translocating P-type ATPase [Pigmentiphaga soli]